MIEAQFRSRSAPEDEACLIDAVAPSMRVVYAAPQRFSRLRLPRQAFRAVVGIAHARRHPCEDLRRAVRRLWADGARVLRAVVVLRYYCFPPILQVRLSCVREIANGTTASIAAL